MKPQSPEAQIVVRVPGTLRSDLEAAADQDGRTLSSLVRKILRDAVATPGKEAR